MAMNRTIVMIHPGGVGDLLLAVPAIQTLRARFPQHQLLLCGHNHVSEFLYKCRLVDRWISVQAAACSALFSGAAPDDPLLKDWLSRCDLAVAWTRDESRRLAATLKHSGASSVVVQSPFDSTLTALHQSDRFLEILMEPPSGCSPMTPLSLPAHLKEQASVSLQTCGLPSDRPLVLIHPGSGSRHKCVEPAVLAWVVQHLERQGLIPLILEGPVDEEPVKRLLSQMPTKPAVLSGLSLAVLAGVLSRVELFVGHDSGMTHLAALLGVPTVALFGPTSPERWRPRGAHVTVVQGESCRCPSWDEVRSCVEKACLQISPDAILAACRAHELPA
jgi:heptosyltransferase-3